MTSRRQIIAGVIFEGKFFSNQEILRLALDTAKRFNLKPSLSVVGTTPTQQAYFLAGIRTHKR